MSSAQARVYDRPTTLPSNGSAFVEAEMPHILQLPSSPFARFKAMVAHAAGATLPKWAAPVVLGVVLTTLFSVILGVSAFIYSDMRTTIRDQSKTIQDQRDILIELRTALKDKDAHDMQQFQKFDNKFDSVDAWVITTNREIVRLQNLRK